MGVNDIIRFYVPDFFDEQKRYAGGNVMHLDTITSPLAEGDFLGNKAMLEKTFIYNEDSGTAMKWMAKRGIRLIEVPDCEQRGVYGWGANVVYLGNRKVLSGAHLTQTNANLRAAGYTVIPLKATTLTGGYGSHHCMIAHLG
ncbi:hypothetical protein HZB01_04600 [Candidatus Woesearchaeota archaeon]|nr:hypothetical protein [Candidatus Woesearchaeota archaeon]